MIHDDAQNAERRLPAGNVTFLFSDIESSTRLLRALGDRYTHVLAEHRGLCRAAFGAHGGVEIGTEGDSFFVVFATARGAIAAAADAQRALHGHRWPADAVVRVRMGMHTGEARVEHGDYVGLDVHRAARIAVAAQGGQVVLSAQTAGLADGAMPAGVSLRELGVFRLKDFDTPERLFQLDVEGLPSEFPPLRTLQAGSTNLPSFRTRFIGRTREIEDARSLLAASRLLTLTGPGGTGKTRLALEVASQALDEFRDGVFVAELATIGDPALVPDTIALALPGAPEDPRRWAIGHEAAGSVAYWQGDFEGARRHYEAGAARVSWALTDYYYALDDLTRNAASLEEALAYFRRAGSRFDLGWAMHYKALVEMRRGHLEAARVALFEGLDLFTSAGDVTGIAILLDDLSDLALLHRLPEDAARLGGGAAALQDTTGAGITDLVSGRKRRIRLGADPDAKPQEAAAFREGRAMPLDEMLRYARETVVPRLLPAERGENS